MYRKYAAAADGSYNPEPADTSRLDFTQCSFVDSGIGFLASLAAPALCIVVIFRVRLPDHLLMMAKDFAEHYHDSWAMLKIDNGWTCGPTYDEDAKKHPNLKQFNKLHERVSGTGESQLEFWRCSTVEK